MTVVIHHDPDCGTSRDVPSILGAGGCEPVVSPYPETWPQGPLRKEDGALLIGAQDRRVS